MAQTLGLTMAAAMLASVSCLDCPTGISDEHCLVELLERSNLLQYTLVHNKQEDPRSEGLDKMAEVSVKAAEEEVWQHKAEVWQHKVEEAKGRFELAQTAEAKAERETESAKARSKAMAKEALDATTFAEHEVEDARMKFESARREQQEAADTSIKGLEGQTGSAADVAVTHMKLLESQAESRKVELERQEIAVVEEQMRSAQGSSEVAMERATTEAARLGREVRNRVQELETTEHAAHLGSERHMSNIKQQTVDAAERAETQDEDASKGLKYLTKDLEKSAVVTYAGLKSRLKREEKRAADDDKELEKEAKVVKDEVTQIRRNVVKKGEEDLRDAELHMQNESQEVTDLAEAVSKESELAKVKMEKSKAQVEYVRAQGLKEMEASLQQATAAAVNAARATKNAEDAGNSAETSRSAARTNTAKVDLLLGDLDSAVEEVKQLVTSLNTTVAAAQQRQRKREAEAGARFATNITNTSDAFDLNYMYNDRNPLERAAWQGHQNVIAANSNASIAPAKSSAPKQALGFAWVSMALFASSVYFN